MSLFQKSVINEYLKNIPDDKINSGWKKIQDYQKISLNKIKEFKEEAKNIKLQIDKTDIEIDKMVYKLYNLTSEEIDLIENS